MDRIKVVISPDGGSCIFLAMLLLLLPLKWVIAALIAILVHEACHSVAIWLLGGRIYHFRIGVKGMQMETDPLPPGRGVIAAFAGPVGSAMLILFAKWMPRTAVCGMVHCIYNLLPLFPLDGGRILGHVIDLCLPASIGMRVFALSQRIFRWWLMLVCFVGALRWGAPFLVIGAVILWQQIEARTV